MEGKTTVAYYRDQPVIRVLISHADSDDGRDQMLQAMSLMYRPKGEGDIWHTGLALVDAECDKDRTILHIIPMDDGDYAKFFHGLDVSILERLIDVSKDTLTRKTVKVEEPRKRTEAGDEIYQGMLISDLCVVDGADTLHIRGFVINGRPLQEQHMSSGEHDKWYGALRQHIFKTVQYVKLIVQNQVGAYIIIPEEAEKEKKSPGSTGTYAKPFINEIVQPTHKRPQEPHQDGPLKGQTTDTLADLFNILCKWNINTDPIMYITDKVTVECAMSSMLEYAEKRVDRVGDSIQPTGVVSQDLRQIYNRYNGSHHYRMLEAIEEYFNKKYPPVVEAFGEQLVFKFVGKNRIGGEALYTCDGKIYIKKANGDFLVHDASMP